MTRQATAEPASTPEDAQNMTRSRTPSLTRPVTVSLLAVAITAAAAQAQVVVDTQPKVVKGVAPEVTVNVSNTSRANQPPATGDLLTAISTIMDADGDTIQDVTYRWLRGDVEIGDKATYTATRDDTDKELRVEVTASTDAENTDPASGTGSVAVTIGNAPPVASQASISGDHIVGSTLTAQYTYSDADEDPEGATEFDWCWYNVGCGKGSGRTYTVTPQDQGRVMEVYIKPKSLTGSPDTGLQARVIAGTAVRYQDLVLGDFGSFWDLPYIGPGNTRTFTANSSASGNASSKTKITLTFGLKESQNDVAIRILVYSPLGNIILNQVCGTNIGPSGPGGGGSAYLLSNCQNTTFERDLSGYPRAGTWRAEVIHQLDGSMSSGGYTGFVSIDTN